MREDKTTAIKEDYHVGWFRGRYNKGPVEPFVGIGSDYKDEPLMGEWLSVSQARKLRDSLDKILKSIEESDFASF